MSNKKIKAALFVLDNLGAYAGSWRTESGAGFTVVGAIFSPGADIHSILNEMAAWSTDVSVNSTYHATVVTWRLGTSNKTNLSKRRTDAPAGKSHGATW